MTPGPRYVVRCPLCGHLGHYDTINSGNTFGAKVYTDGRQVAPMLPEIAPVALCRGCSGAFWLKQAQALGSYEPYGLDADRPDPAWAAADRLGEPDEGTYFQWMDRLLAWRPERERALRLHAWWRGNDRHRGGKPAEADAGPDHVVAREANMRALLPLLHSADDSDALMRAEVHRELGEFSQALSELAAPLPDGFGTAVRRLRSLAEAGDRQVRELW